MRYIFHHCGARGTPARPGRGLALLLALLPLVPSWGGEGCCASHAAAVGPAEILRQAGETLAAGLDAAGATLVGRLADTVMEDVVPGTVLRAPGGKGKADPLELLAELVAALTCPDCGKPLPLPAEAVAAANGNVFDQARQATARPGAAVGPLAGCCLVIPLLGTPDESWDAAATASLPEWFRAPPWKEHSEAFALHAGRPATAYHLAEPAAPTDGGDPLSAYLLRAADRMAAERDYPAELACLHVGLRLAQKQNDVKQIGEFACLIGERMADYGVPAEGASFLETILAAETMPTHAGKLQAMRLAFLFKAGDVASVAAESDRLLAGKQYPEQRLHFLYLAWATNRRAGEQDKAKLFGDNLLESYPAHPLAAEVLYDQAMNALTKADYEEAHALLSRIQREFPEARIHKRANALLGRLASLLAASRSDHPAW